MRNHQAPRNPNNTTKKYLLPLLLLTFTGPLSAADQQHRLFTDILQDHVRDGLVDYAALKQDERLEQYIAQLGATDPAALTGDREAEAFWLNVYNAYTLKLIVDNYPLESINELHLFGSLYLGVIFKRTVWRTWKFPINGREYTLDEVEHEILQPVYKDYRHHSAFVCASLGCPPLRDEAFEAAKLEAQLDDQMRIWMADSSRNYYHQSTKTLRVSQIFSWFEEDFVADGRGLVEVLSPYMPAEMRLQVESAGDELEVMHIYYDWGLNVTES